MGERAEGHERIVLARVPPRAAALFFGLFSLANAVVALRTGRTEDLWWIDLSGLPAWTSAALWLTAVLLVAYAVAPTMGTLRRNAAAAASALLALGALWNAVGFYGLPRDSFRPAVPLPFSAVVALVFAGIAFAMWKLASRRSGRWEGVGVVITALALAFVFPLAHVYFFGTTDYRRPAEVAVVFGAKVHESGTLSVSLEDRVRTACGLYREGLVSRLVMSGGAGESGYDETVAMRDRALELGVPASAIVLDNGGVDTDHTVANTVALFEGDATRRVLVVSQFYHLPRIKMAYRAAGWNVYTVPAEPSRPISKTPLLVAREVPAFWVYWGRAWLRAVFG